MKAADGSRGRILIIDDDATIRATMTEMLEDQGYSVTCAANGWEALTQLRAVGPPDLIMLDLMMPVMDGWEFRRQQLKDPVLASIPVIVFSSWVDREGEASSPGGIHYLPQETAPDHLLRLVARYCRGRCPS